MPACVRVLRSARMTGFCAPTSIFAASARPFGSPETGARRDSFGIAGALPLAMGWSCNSLSRMISVGAIGGVMAIL